MIAVLPADPAPAINQAVADLTRLRTSRLDLETGRGRYAHTPAGQAARALQDASRRRREAEGFAAHADTGWRMRRWWRKEAALHQTAEANARQAWNQVASPTLALLDHTIDRAQHQLDQLQGEQTSRVRWLQQHPDAAHRLTAIDAQLTAVELDRRLAHSLERAINEPLSPSLDRALGL